MADPDVEGRSLLLDTIRAVTVACRTWGVYPADHPAVRHALEAASARLGAAVAAIGPLAFGVGRGDLRAGTWTLDSPQARALAHALYVRQVAILHIDGALEPAELQALVAWLGGPAVPVDPGAITIGLPGLPATGRVRVQPLDYSVVRLVDDTDAASPGARPSLADRLLQALAGWPAEERDREGSEGSLEGPAASPETAIVAWLRDLLEAEAARASGAATPAGAEGSTEEPMEPAGIPGWVADETGAPTPTPEGSEAPPGLPSDAVVARLGDAIRAHLASAPGAARVLAARQTAELLLRLPEPLRERLAHAAFRVLATDPDGEEALHALAGPLGSRSVLHVLRQLAAEGVPLSGHAQQLIEVLAATDADEGAEAVPAPALEALRAELLALFRAEDIDRYNPEDHLALLARAILAWPTRAPILLGSIESLGDRVASLADDAVARQLGGTLLDLAEHGDDRADPAPVLDRLEHLVEGALARGLLDDVLVLVRGIERLATSAREPVRVATRGVLDRLARVEIMTALATALGTPGSGGSPEALALVRALGPAGIRSLLQILADEPVRARRRRVFDLLGALGQDVVPEATPWLSHPHWYVVRNVVALLRTVGDRSSLGTIRRVSEHPDLRVRLEALRTLLELDPTVGHARLIKTLADPDPRVATAAAELAGQHGDPDMVTPLLRVLASWDLSGRRQGVRVAALRALGRIGRPETLPRLARFFRGWWLPPVSDVERRAAYESLAGYPLDAREPWISRGIRSRDPHVRALCGRLQGAGQGVEA